MWQGSCQGLTAAFLHGLQADLGWHAVVMHVVVCVWGGGEGMASRDAPVVRLEGRLWEGMQGRGVQGVQGGARGGGVYL